MREILSGIYTWPWFSEPHGYNFNGHLILHAGGNLCIDPVEPTVADLEEIARLGVSQILLTNRNHSRAANQIRARTGARTAIHPADAPHARKEGAELDDELNLGDKIGPLVVVGAPGKSPGEVVLHWPERKILIVGDAVVGDPPGKLQATCRKKLSTIHLVCGKAFVRCWLWTSIPCLSATARPFYSRPRSGFESWWIVSR